MSLRTRLALVGSSFLLAGLFGCSTLADLGFAVPYLGDPPVTSIEQLNGKPKGALVYLRGVVKDAAPFVNGGAYLLKDESGSIWIRTGSPRLPKTGTEIVIQGQIEFQTLPQGVPVENEVYVRELQQMEAVATRSVVPAIEPKPTVSPLVPAIEPKPTVSPLVEGKPPQVEVIPLQPPAVAKPARDSIDAFFLPHKQERK
jgi:hypothetical protein